MGVQLCFDYHKHRQKNFTFYSDEMGEYSNRVPISVNGNCAEAVVSTGSNIPNCWMSFAYFSRIGFGRDNITQIPGVDTVEDASGNECAVLGVPNCVLDLKIGDCPTPFKVRPFIIEFGNEGYTFWNDFQLTGHNLRKWKIVFEGAKSRITIGIANGHQIRLSRKRPNEPMYIASLFTGPSFDVDPH